MITQVQNKTVNSGATSVTSQAITFDATPTAGNYVFLAVGSNGFFNVVGSGIEWDFTSLPNTAGGSRVITLLVGKVYSGASATVTVYPDASSVVAISALELNCGGLLSLDGQRWAHAASGTALSSGAGRQISGDGLMIAAFRSSLSGGATFSAASPAGLSTMVQTAGTLGNTSNNSVAIAWMAAAPAGGALTAACTASGTALWDAVQATYRVMTPAATPPPRARLWV